MRSPTSLFSRKRKQREAGFKKKILPDFQQAANRADTRATLAGEEYGHRTHPATGLIPRQDFSRHMFHELIRQKLAKKMKLATFDVESIVIVVTGRAARTAWPLSRPICNA